MNPLALIEPGVLVRVVTSLAVVAIVLVARALAARAIRRHLSDPDLQRRWNRTARNSLLLLLALGLITIWAHTIQTFVFSMVAVAVAIVIATKELLVCVLGSLVRGISDAYAVGDRVTIGTHRGDVVDHNLLTTTLLEVEPDGSAASHTGRLVTVPNAVILQQPVVNESRTGAIVAHAFTVPARLDRRWRDLQHVLEAAATEASRPCLERARAQWGALARRRHVAVSPPEPLVTVAVVDARQIAFHVRVPCPAGQQAAMQETIVRAFLEAREAGRPARAARPVDAGLAAV